MAARARHDDGPPRRPILDEARKEHMLAVLIRNREAFEAAHADLTPDHLRPLGEAYAVLWELVCKFYDRHRALPARAQLHAAMDTAAAADRTRLIVESREEIARFIRRAFSKTRMGKGVATGATYRDDAIADLGLYLQEHHLKQLKTRAADDSMIVADLGKMLRAAATDVEHAEQLRSGIAREPVFPEGWDKAPPVPVIPSGDSALDRFLGGGWVAGEVVLLMGPYGSCKTLWGVALAAHQIARCALLARAGECPEGKKPVVFVVSGEMDVNEFRLRLLSCMARIPHDRLRAVGVNNLSRAPKPGATPETDYEKREFGPHAKGAAFECEYDRARRVMETINEFCVFLEFTDAHAHGAKLGRGGVKDIAGWVAGILRAEPTLIPAFFVIDHASALARKILRQREADSDELRHVLTGIVQDCGSMLAKSYQAPVLLLHQLSGESNSRGPFAELDHTNAGECRTIGEFSDFAFVVHKPLEAAERLAKVRCTKHRRQPPSSDAIIRIDGAMSRIIDVTEDYQIVPSVGFVRNEEAEGYGVKNETLRWMNRLGKLGVDG